MARGGAAAHRWMTPMTSAQRRARSGVVVRADGTPAELAPLEQRVDLRVGKVLSAKKHEEADKLVRVG
jgi:tRNA-binding EMAP/Myf-like protein